MNSGISKMKTLIEQYNDARERLGYDGPPMHGPIPLSLNEFTQFMNPSKNIWWNNDVRRYIVTWRCGGEWIIGVSEWRRNRGY
jgi:hypothetical protein